MKRSELVKLLQAPTSNDEVYLEVLGDVIEISSVIWPRVGVGTGREIRIVAATIEVDGRGMPIRSNEPV